MHCSHCNSPRLPGRSATTSGCTRWSLHSWYPQNPHGQLASKQNSSTPASTHKHMASPLTLHGSGSGDTPKRRHCVGNIEPPSAAHFPSQSRHDIHRAQERSSASRVAELQYPIQEREQSSPTPSILGQSITLLPTMHPLSHSLDLAGGGARHLVEQQRRGSGHHGGRQAGARHDGIGRIG